MKPVIPRVAAETDVNDIFAYYREQGGPSLAERFVDDFDSALLHIARHPGTGSVRYAGHVPGLRFWTLRHFPLAVFYVEQADFIDIVRVLHQARDLPIHLS